jgi:hypothetical protein
MKKTSVLAYVILVMFFAFLLITPAMADEEADRNTCKAKGEKAIELIKEVGLEAACLKIHYSGPGEFHWDGGWVEVIDDEKATYLAMPPFPGLLGQEAINAKDDDGKLFYQEFIQIANTKGKGWTTFVWRMEKRDTYVLKVPDENAVVISVLRY